MALKNWKQTLVGTFMGLSAATPAIPEPPAFTTPIAVSQLPYATEAEATQQSINGVLLHVGEGFSENSLQALVDFLDDTYNVSVYLGGTDNHIDLFINGKKGGKPFDTVAALSVMPKIIEKYAPEGAKVASSGEELIPEKN